MSNCNILYNDCHFDFLSSGFCIFTNPTKVQWTSREPRDSRVKILIFKCIMSMRSLYPQRRKGNVHILQIQCQQALCKIQKPVSITLILAFKFLEQWQWNLQWNPDHTWVEHTLNYLHGDCDIWKNFDQSWDHWAMKRRTCEDRIYDILIGYIIYINNIRW